MRTAFIWCPALPRVCGFVNCWVSGIPLRRESPPRERLMRRLGEDRPGEGSAKHTAGASFLPDEAHGSDLPKPQWTRNAAPGRTALKCDCSFFKTPGRRPLSRAYRGLHPAPPPVPDGFPRSAGPLPWAPEGTSSSLPKDSAVAADTTPAPRSGARPRVFVTGADPGLGLVGGTGWGEMRETETEVQREREAGERECPRLCMKLPVAGEILSVSVSRQTDRQTDISNGY